MLKAVRPTVISDELWALLEPVLPADRGRPGRPWNDHRLTLEAIFWRFLTDSPWRELPHDLGAWKSVWERHRRWSADGTYERMLAVIRDAADGKDSDLGALLSLNSGALRSHN